MISNEDPVFNQEMSEVEMNIEALRQQTEQIRLKIMRVATETPSRLRKTFDSPPP
jgi:predicted  nucleic acid-binding Zn-ribbon protein